MLLQNFVCSIILNMKKRNSRFFNETNCYVKCIFHYLKPVCQAESGRNTLYLFCAVIRTCNIYTRGRLEYIAEPVQNTA